MGMYEHMFKGQSYKFDLTNNNNNNAFEFNRDKSVSTWQPSEFDRTISFENYKHFYIFNLHLLIYIYIYINDF